MKYWLLKSEPETFSINDLEIRKKEPWTGVRNYQARNIMRDEMSVGDICFFYHSSCKIPGIVGICKISKTKVIDETQFDKNSKYFDIKSKKENPTWVCIEVNFFKKFKEILTLENLKKQQELSNMVLLQKGSRLSVQPVTKEEFDHVIGML